jgi:hypothetical protein
MHTRSSTDECSFFQVAFQAVAPPVPILLCYAMTIVKTERKTMDRLGVYCQDLYFIMGNSMSPSQ